MLASIVAAAFSLALAVNPANARVTSSLERRQSASGFVNPTTNGGSWLTSNDGDAKGEPLNVIISNQSDAGVLTAAGFDEYMESLYYSPGDCQGITLGGPQFANLGDGNTQQFGPVRRYNFMQGDDGTCLESIRGGNHFRYFAQNGSTANTGAWFLAVSYEASASEGHTIVSDGYDLGRDLLVGNATVSNGTRSPGGFIYQTTSTNANLLSDLTASDINHNIGVDGNVAVLTVRITTQGTLGAGRIDSNGGSSTSGNTTTTSSSGAVSSSPSRLLLVLCLLVAIITLSNCPSASAEPIPARGHLRDDVAPTIYSRATSDDPPFFQLGQNLSKSSNPDPLPKDSKLFSNATPTAITNDLRSRINAFSPYAAAAYCVSFQNGSPTGCGRPCDDLAGIKMLYHTGDGDITPHAFVTYDKSNKTLTVTHEGSTFSKLFSLLNDFVFVPVPPAFEISTVLSQVASNSTHIGAGPLGQLVSGVAATIKGDLVLVHVGFLAAWSRSYQGVLAAVQQGLKTYPETERIWITGHSLGAAIATLDMIALRGAISTKVPIEALVFASPRVGNPPFAVLVDALVSDKSQNLRFSHVVNSNDIIPHLGPLITGYQHSFNEVFLPVNGSNQAVLCPGRENVNCALSRGFNASLAYHDGPFLGRNLGRGDSGDCTS